MAPSKKPGPTFRLIKRPAQQQLSSSSKRLKSTGVEFVLRKLSYADKMQTNDEVHQSIEICPVTKVLLDTLAFQRLRNIMQLGTSEYLYTCANGNRFQHSLGVAHLAERMCKTIASEQPNLGATDKDVLCVKLAGLLHDIGHGPLSHLYETFRDRALPAYLDAYPELKDEYKDCEDLIVPEGWTHEQSSLQMIDAALEELGLQIDLDNLDQPLKQIGNGIDAKSMKVFKPVGVEDSVLTSRDFVFVKECILGGALQEVVEKFGENRCIGRNNDETKEWLFDIVNNRHSGLDVDKIDYFARDQIRALGNGSIDLKMVEDARVARCQDEHGRYRYMICYPLKRVEATMDFFKKRLHLHTIIYQNKKTVAVGLMICDILCSADPYFRMLSDDGEKYPISRAVLKSKFLMKCDDHVLRDIEMSTHPGLEEARALCRRLKKHQMYKCAVDQPLDFECAKDSIVWKMKDQEIKDGMLRLFKGAKSPEPLEAEDFTIEKYYMHLGQKKDNPLSKVCFFEEMNEKLIGPMEELPKAESVDGSKYRSIIPTSMQKAGVRIFCRDSNDSTRALVNQLFHQWFESVGEEAYGEPEATPYHAGAQLQFHQESDDDDDDDMEDNNLRPVMLSQDLSDDEDEPSRAHAPLDQSPIPLRTRTRCS